MLPNNRSVDTPEDRLHRGEVLRDGNQLEEAKAVFVALTEDFPNNEVYWFKLGTVLERAGEIERAEAAYQSAITCRDVYPEAINNLALLALRRCDYDYAETLLRGILGECPDYFESHINLGNTLLDTGRAAEAQYHFQRAVGIKPESALAHSRLGVTLRNRRRTEEAIALLEKAVALDSDHPGAWNNLGTCYFERGRHSQADAAFKRSIDLDDKQEHAWHNWLFLGNFLHIGTKELFERHRQYGLHLKSRIAATSPLMLGRRRVAHPRVRIGLVSGDLRRHSVAYFLLSLLEPLSKHGVDVYAYSTNRQEDAISGLIKEKVKVWRLLVGLDDEKAVDVVRRDNIDFAFDLSGHTGHTRLNLFAHRLAPIQVAWIGYPNTTGMETLDYRFTDEIADPAGMADAVHTERLVRLPSPFLCFSPPLVDLLPATPPASSGAPFTFGSFNARVKLGDACLRLWCEVLQAIPASRLLIKSGNGLDDEAGRTELREHFREYGISDDRVEIHGAQSSDESHLSFYGHIDACLDAYPYNGTTTTCEALWMGVPVVTLVGDHHSSRVGSSLMMAIGLEGLVAETPAKFVEIAKSLTEDIPRLEQLRKTMRQRLQSSPLMDADRMARNIAGALQDLWRQHCERFADQEDRWPPVPDPQMLFGAVPVPKLPLRKGQQNLSFHLHTQDGGVRVVPATPTCLSTFVFLEQQRWFEFDVSYLSSVVEAGGMVVDIGANIGAYAIPLALALGETGQLIAYEPSAENRTFLEASLAANKLTNILIRPQAVSSSVGSCLLKHGPSGEFNMLAPGSAEAGEGEWVEVTTLDHDANMLQWRDVDILKIDAEGAELRIVAGAGDFLRRFSPLVLFEVKDAEQFSADLRWTLMALGYRIFRLSGDGEYLIPFAEDEIMDRFLVNLYAAKEDRITRLEQRGLLVTEQIGFQISPDERDVFSRSYCTLPFAQDFEISSEDVTDAEVGDALIAWMAYRDRSLPATRRHAALCHAVEQLTTLEKEASSMGRIISLARMCMALGARFETYLLLKKAGRSLEQDVTIDEPFWPALDRYTEGPREIDERNWIECQVMEATEIVRAHSSANSAADFDALHRLARNPLASPEMRRRLLLLAAREGLEADAVADLFSAETDGNVENLWSSAGYVFLREAYES